MEYGCIGERLSHSFSREIHRELTSDLYELIELAPCEVGGFLTSRDFRAINVTIPYKEAVLPYLDEIDECARAIGAVNTVVHRCGRLYGYNTDFYGLRELIACSGISVREKKVAILGSGGTAKTARAVLASLGAKEILTVSRTPVEGKIGYDTLTCEHTDIDVLINTTPVGMAPNVEGTPLSLDAFPRLSLVLDAVYHPFRTNLVLEAQRRGIVAEGGLYMLVTQAVRASELFHNTTYPEGTVERVYRKILSEKENLVLIGMPSSGKSTVGKMLAEALGRPFYDTDEMVRERYGISPEEVITMRGEETFREMESEICLDASRLQGAVIATGGGVVVREENMRALSREGRVIFLDRPLCELCPSIDRPLTQDHEALRERYAQRIDKYRLYSDITIQGSHSPEETLKILLDRIQ